MPEVDKSRIRAAVGLILWLDWDPIDLNSNDNLNDEYRNFEPRIVELVCSGASFEQFEETLRSMEIEIYGHDVNAGRRTLVAT